MIQRQLYHQVHVTAHKGWNLEHIAQPAGSSSCWRVTFPGGSAGLCFFQAAYLNCLFGGAQLVSQQSLHLCVWGGGETS